ncbi:MAG: DNA adenine methylase [Paludibacteraceae bacterium]|nr:DNA adenine methylase [Paludibacteraceae bacterium]
MGIKDYTFLDLFSGSGIVSRLAKIHGAKKIIANDLEYYSMVLNTIFLRNEEGDKKEFEEMKNEILSKPLFEGWVCENYAPKDDNDIRRGERCFYTRENALIIDSYLESLKELPCEVADMFLAPLIYEASVHTNTSGVFKGFYKNKQGIGQFGGEGKNALQRICGKIDPKFPVFCPNETENIIISADASSVVKDTKIVEQAKGIDITYIDPPYNQHPYGSNYFMLNAIAKCKCPEEISKVSGIPKDWNRSIYNKRVEGVMQLLKDIENVDSKYVLLSYSSEAYLPIKDMVAELAKIGLITNLQEIDYNVFRGSRNLSNRPKKLQEYLITIRK